MKSALLGSAWEVPLPILVLTGIYGGLYTGRIHMMNPGEIRAHVFDLFESSGQGGGLVVSSHDLDISTTEEQLDALVGAIKECRY